MIRWDWRRHREALLTELARWNWRRHRVGNPDPEAFLAELAASYPGKTYKPMDRYRDFRRVFLSDEQGRRVLYEVMSFCGMFRSAAPRANFDPYHTAFLNGQQDIAFKLLATMNAEPKARPASTKE